MNPDLSKFTTEECIFEYRGSLAEALSVIESLGMAAKKDNDFFDF